MRFVLSAPAYFVMVPLLLTWLGREKYGVWVLITTITGWLFMSDLGLRTLIVRQAGMSSTSGNRAELELTIRHAAAMYLGVLAVVLLLATGSLGWIVRSVLAVPPNLAQVATRVLAFGVVAFCVDLIGLGLFRGVSDGLGFIALNNLVAIVYTWIRTAVVLAVAFATRDVAAMAAASLCVSIAGLLAWRATAARAAPGLTYRPSIPRREDLGMLVGFSGLVQINDSLAAATPQLVEAFVVRRFGLSVLGLFDVGVQLYTHARSLSFVSWFPVMPWLSSRVGERRETRYIASRLAGIAALAAAAALGVTSLVNPLLALWLPLATKQEVSTISTLVCVGVVVGSIAPLVYAWNASAEPWKTTVCLLVFALGWIVPLAAGLTRTTSQVGVMGLAAACAAAATGRLLNPQGGLEARNGYTVSVGLMVANALIFTLAIQVRSMAWAAPATAVVAGAALYFLNKDLLRRGWSRDAR